MTAIAIMATMSFSSCERVDAGHEGIWVSAIGRFFNKNLNK